MFAEICDNRGMQTELQELRRELRALRAEMKALGVKRTSCFNGGMTRESQRYNERCFALETRIDDLNKAKGRTV